MEFRLAIEVLRCLATCFSLFRHIAVLADNFFLRISVLQLGGCKLSGTQFERVNCFVELIERGLVQEN